MERKIARSLIQITKQEYLILFVVKEIDSSYKIDLFKLLKISS